MVLFEAAVAALLPRSPLIGILHVFLISTFEFNLDFRVRLEQVRRALSRRARGRVIRGRCLDFRFAVPSPPHHPAESQLTTQHTTAWAWPRRHRSTAAVRLGDKRQPRPLTPSWASALPWPASNPRAPPPRPPCWTFRFVLLGVPPSCRHGWIVASCRFNWRRPHRPHCRRPERGSTWTEARGWSSSLWGRGGCPMGAPGSLHPHKSHPQSRPPVMCPDGPTRGRPANAQGGQVAGRAAGAHPWRHRGRAAVTECRASGGPAGPARRAAVCRGTPDGAARGRQSQRWAARAARAAAAATDLPAVGHGWFPLRGAAVDPAHGLCWRSVRRRAQLDWGGAGLDARSANGAAAGVAVRLYQPCPPRARRGSVRRGRAGAS